MQTFLVYLWLVCALTRLPLLSAQETNDAAGSGPAASFATSGLQNTPSALAVSFDGGLQTATSILQGASSSYAAGNVEPSPAVSSGGGGGGGSAGQGSSRGDAAATPSFALQSTPSSVPVAETPLLTVAADVTTSYESFASSPATSQSTERLAALSTGGTLASSSSSSAQALESTPIPPRDRSFSEEPTATPAEPSLATSSQSLSSSLLAVAPSSTTYGVDGTGSASVSSRTAIPSQDIPSPSFSVGSPGATSVVPLQPSSSLTRDSISLWPSQDSPLPSMMMSLSSVFSSPSSLTSPSLSSPLQSATALPSTTPPLESSASSFQSSPSSPLLLQSTPFIIETSSSSPPLFFSQSIQHPSSVSVTLVLLSASLEPLLTPSTSRLSMFPGSVANPMATSPSGPVSSPMAVSSSVLASSTMAVSSFAPAVSTRAVSFSAPAVSTMAALFSAPAVSTMAALFSAPAVSTMAISSSALAVSTMATRTASVIVRPLPTSATAGYYTVSITLDNVVSINVADKDRVVASIRQQLASLLGVPESFITEVELKTRNAVSRRQGTIEFNVVTFRLISENRQKGQAALDTLESQIEAKQVTFMINGVSYTGTDLQTEEWSPTATAAPTGLSAGATVGIVIGVIVGTIVIVMLVGAIVYLIYYKHKSASYEFELHVSHKNTHKDMPDNLVGSSEINEKAIP